jgi:hypothetical protein
MNLRSKRCAATWKWRGILWEDGRDPGEKTGEDSEEKTEEDYVIVARALL